MSTKETAKKEIGEASFVRETALRRQSSGASATTVEKVVQPRRVALGQYFTPLTVVEFMYQMLLAMMSAKDKRTPRIIDPASGEGIFLKYALDNRITISHQIYGLDIDPTIETRWKELDLFGKINLYLQDGLLDTEDRKVSTEHSEEIVGRFDIVIGNPPYGGMGIKNLNENKKLMDKIRKFELWGLAKIENNGEKKLTFDFYHDYRYRNLTPEEITKIERTPIEILFLERFIQLARPGKWIAIIVPDGILANTNLQYVRNWVMQRTKIKTIVSLPRETFKYAKTTAKTSVMFLQKLRKDEIVDPKMEIFMAVSEYVGVSNPEKNDLPIILEEFKKSLRGEKIKEGHMSPIIKNVTLDDGFRAGTLRPEYWDPKYDKMIKLMKKNWENSPLKEIVPQDALIMGDHVRKSKGEKLGKDFPYKYYDAVGFLETGYDTTNIETCSKNAYERLKRTEVKKDDILIACSGVAAVGRICLIDFDPGKSCTGAVFTLRTTSPNPYFITVFLKTKYGRSQIDRIKDGVGTVNITGDDVFGLQVPLLPENIQQEIEEEYKKMSKFHYKAMEIKSALIRKGKNVGEAEKDPLYLRNIKKAEKLLTDLVKRTEEVIEGKRENL